jgi:hypothetical protein
MAERELNSADNGGPTAVGSSSESQRAMSIETLESRVKAVVVEACRQVLFPAQVCAWTRIIN